MSAPPERAAAVCYQVGEGGVELLLVRTSGHPAWTFPKGRRDPADCDLRAAALREACEEAGVHGDLDAQPLVRYRYPAGHEGDRLVEAYLLHVLTQRSPGRRERFRDPTWFGPEEAQARLAEGRVERYVAEHERVIEAALSRIAERGPV